MLEYRLRIVGHEFRLRIVGHVSSYLNQLSITSTAENQFVSEFFNIIFVTSPKLSYMATHS